MTAAGETLSPGQLITVHAQTEEKAAPVATAFTAERIEGADAVLAAATLPAKIATVQQVSREVLSNSRAFASQKIQVIQNKINRPRGS